jgi:hypothetical protein
MIKQVSGIEVLGHSTVYSGTNRESLEMMGISVDQEWSEWHSRLKKLQRWWVPTSPKQ